MSAALIDARAAQAPRGGTMRRGRAFGWACAAAAVAGALACSGVAPVEPVCTPGESRSCACSNGAIGAQLCDDDGARLGPCDCAEPIDASSRPDAGRPEPDSGPRDSGPEDAGADARASDSGGRDGGDDAAAGPAECDYSIYRGNEQWCADIVVYVARDYGCELIWDRGEREWHGTPEAIRSAAFLLDWYEGEWLYACRNAPPPETADYRRRCVPAFEVQCAAAETDEAYRGGTADWRALCAAARERGRIERFSIRDSFC